MCRSRSVCCSSLSAGDVRYRYDDLSRLVAARGGGQQDDTTFRYDALDRRDQKVEPVSGADQTFEYFYVGLSERLSGEQDPDRVKVKSYDYDSNLWGQGQETKTSAATRYRSYAIDANGSVEGLEGPDGELAEQDRYRYDPYGQQETAESGLSADARENPLRFEGFYFDPGPGVYDMHARPYRPEVGRFLTEDRFEAASGDLALLSDPLTNNRYAFAGGNPVNNVEFDGHYSGNEGGAQRITSYDGGNTPRARGDRPVPVSRRERAIPGRSDSTGYYPPSRSASGEAPLSDAGSTGSGYERPPVVRIKPLSLSAPCMAPTSGPAAGSLQACGVPRIHDVGSAKRCVAPATENGCYITSTVRPDFGPLALAVPFALTRLGFAAATARTVPARPRSPAAPAAKQEADEVADDLVVVRGGTKEMPAPGETFSGAAGRTLDEAASGVPHGQIRVTTAGQIRAGGGTVKHAPELTRSGVMNPLHVNICLGRGRCPFGPLQPNPVPKVGRIR
jgi:RHS repeat-associated protein